MEKVYLRFKENKIEGEVAVPGSKSISNRMLVLEYLLGSAFNLKNLSTSTDTQEMIQLLSVIEKVEDISEEVYLNCGNAGTIIRFLSALLAFKDGVWILDGSARMRERPIAPLVDTLKNAGIQIQYLGQVGFAPIKIYGSSECVEKGEAYWEIDASVSSQFVSALMMVACKFSKGVRLCLVGQNKVSIPYIQMTAQILCTCGMQVEFIDGSNIFVCGNLGKTTSNYIEADWTSVSYFYGLLALSKGGELFIPNLREDSWQGDRVLSEWFEQWGIESVFEPSGLRLIRRNLIRPDKVEIDFTHHPDLAQTMAVVCAGSGVEAILSGLSSLRHKETDRVEALLTELRRMDIRADQKNVDEIQLYPSTCKAKEVIKTYSDHRMAMSFSVFSVLFPVEIENPQVVSKSYNNYWEDLASVGAETRFSDDV